MHIDVDIGNQALSLIDDAGHALRCYTVSTAARGAGEIRDSLCTPRGWHIVRAKIGAGSPPGTVFVGRRATGERFSPELRLQHPDRDWILTRILWLSGTEPGRNRLGPRDTMQRYIYIHGAPDEDPMGVPGSHGCVKMRNEDVIDLFDRVATGTRVYLHE